MKFPAYDDVHLENYTSVSKAHAQVWKHAESTYKKKRKKKKNH